MSHSIYTKGIHKQVNPSFVKSNHSLEFNLMNSPSYKKEKDKNFTATQTFREKE